MCHDDVDERKTTVVVVIKIKNSAFFLKRNNSKTKEKLTPEIDPPFRTLNDDTVTSLWRSTILRTFRVARRELVYTRWVMYEKKL